jgi:1-aminocyclopropane-1-carboxylate deaminase/D-cysteine desulfhydrase-like pyridoxal-dependent ACC family enzyme
MKSNAKISLIRKKTPLEKLQALSAHLGGPEIFIKRDDLINFAMGGNKVRKMEYYIAEAVKAKASTVISIGAPHSNHTRVVSVAASYLGLTSTVLVMSKKPRHLSGNLLLNSIVGANLVYLNKPIHDFSDRLKLMEKTAANLTENGEIVFIVPVAGAVGCLGPYDACTEMLAQARQKGISVQHQIVAVGSGESFTGIHLAGEEIGKVVTHGICVGRMVNQIKPTIAQLINETLELLGKKRNRVMNLKIYDQYLGDATVSTPEALEAIKLVARLEGIFLDPIYTGKAMAGLIDLIQRKHIRAKESVVFWHTGNPSSLFSHIEDFESKSRR